MSITYSGPFRTIDPRSDTPLLIFGDHASAHIPPRYKDLGLSGDDLTRHIAHDIGTETIISALCERFGAAGHICGFSRLLIDANRDPNALGLIPQTSDGTDIPGNSGLPEMERAVRMAEFYTPYHGGLARAVEGLKRAQANPLIISVHSFTPQPLSGLDSENGRAMDLALLVKEDTATADKFMAGAAKHLPALDSRINEPYSAHDLNYTIDVHAGRSRHLAIEIRQDHIGDEHKASAYAAILGDIIAELI